MLREGQIKSLEKMMDKAKDYIFVVEGKRDANVLSDLGIKDIFTISGTALDSVAEKIEARHKSIVILTDFDRDGEKKEKILERFLCSSSAHIERKVRKFFKESLKITKIEELKEAAKLVNNRESCRKGIQNCKVLQMQN